MSLAPAEARAWRERGFFLVEGFASSAQLRPLIERAEALAREAALSPERPVAVEQAIVLGEPRLLGAAQPADRASKVFKVHRQEPAFHAVATDARVLARVAALLGGEVDCFLSQFIFKRPGSLGQPWHQDQFYFRLEPSPQVGIWLACTEATLENGPLWVVPGSHREAIHADVERDPRPDAPIGYVEIQGADTAGEEPVLMAPGDLLVFHSHLRHRSTDNRSQGMRAAMVYHYAHADSVGERGFNHDWLPVLRGGAPAPEAGR